jgi:DNA-3-methyladenine glycosylase I
MNSSEQLNLVRCGWNTFEDPLYRTYHDKEWGVPVYDDRKIFEFLVLESAQAGLSWATVLRKRENYRLAFAGFHPVKVSKFSAKDVEVLLGNAGIIRNRLKIEAAINNAGRFLEIQKEFGTFSQYIWRFVGGKPIVNRWKSIKDLPAITPQAEALARDLKLRGFKFLGPTVIYAHMQATGMVNDHTVDCFRHKEITTQYSKTN